MNHLDCSELVKEKNAEFDILKSQGTRIKPPAGVLCAFTDGVSSKYLDVLIYTQ